MTLVSIDLVEVGESKVLGWVRNLLPGLNARRDHLWYYTVILPGGIGFLGFFLLIITFHANGSLDETGKAPLFLLILLYSVLPFVAHFYLIISDVLLPNFLLLFQMLQLGFAIALCALGYLDRQWYALGPILAFVLFPTLSGWCYGVFCFGRCRQRSSLAQQRGTRSFWKSSVTQSRNEDRSGQTGLLELEFAVREQAERIPSPSLGPLLPEQAQSEIYSDGQFFSSPSTRVEQSDSPLAIQAQSHSHGSGASITVNDIAFERNLIFAENFMPLCAYYGFPILLIGAIEMIANLPYSKYDTPASRNRSQQQAYILGFILPALDLFSLSTFVLWTVSQRGIRIRAYAFEAMQLCVTVGWIILTVLFMRAGRSNEDYSGVRFIILPILISLHLVNSTVHILFIAHFGNYLHLEQDLMGNRIMLE